MSYPLFKIGSNNRRRNSPPQNGADENLLLNWCGTMGGDACLDGIGHLPKFGSDFGLENQKAFYVLGCLSGGKAACKGLKDLRATWELNAERSCKEKSKYSDCEYYSRVLVTKNSINEARALLQSTCENSEGKLGCHPLSKLNEKFPQ